MADIHYGGDREGYQDALARMKAQQAQEAELEKATQKRAAAEDASTRAGAENLTARKSSTAVISDQAAAIEASAGALQRETSLLAANTAAWARAAETRAGALATTRAFVTAPTVTTPAVVEPPVAAAPPVVAPPVTTHRATTVGYSEELAQFRAQQAAAATEGAAAQLAATDAANAAALRAAAAKVQPPIRTSEERETLAAAEAQRERNASAIEGAVAGRRPEVIAAEAARARTEAINAAAASVLAAKAPAPLYHGTDRPPVEVASTGLPEGAYLASTQQEAELYGRHVYEVRSKGLKLAQDRSDLLQGYYQVPAGVPPTAVTPIRPAGRGLDQGLGVFGPAQGTENQLKFARASEEAKASLAGVDGEVARSAANWRLYTAETAAASQALTRHGALSTEFIQAFARGEVTLAEFGTALTSTIGKFAGWAVAGGLVYGAFEALKQVVRGATETATGVAQLERAQIPGFNRTQAEEGLRRTAARTNVPISEVANAQFFAARAGFNKNLPETQSAGETAVLAFKLDEVPVQEAARGLGAVRQAFGLNAGQIRSVFNELDVGQLKFNARLQQTLPYLGRSSSAFAEAGGSIQQLVRQIVEVTGAVPGGGGGGGSGSAATFFTREPGNLRKPQSEDILRLYGFDPHQPIGDLNEAIQQAVKNRRAPAGQLLEPVQPGQRTPLTPAQQGTFRLAEAVSGGPALAGRYGIQLVNQAATGRAEAITKELSKAEGASAEDLKAKLGQFNEQVSAIGHTFERVGSEIGESGITSAGEDLLSILKKIGEATAFVVQPLGALGGIFSSLPAGLQDLVIGFGALAAVSKAGGFNLLAPNTDREYVGAAKRTTSDALARQRTNVERRSAELDRGGEREYEIAREKERFAHVNAPLLVGPNALPYNDKKRTELQAQQQEIDARLKSQRDANNRTTEQLVTAHEQLYALEARDQLINDGRLQVSQKAQKLRNEGVYVAPGRGRTIIAPGGEEAGARLAAQQGYSAYAAERVATARGPAFVAGPIGSGAKLTEPVGARESAAFAASLAFAGRENTRGAASLGEAWTLAVAQIKKGGEEMGVALDALAAELVAASVRAGSLAEIKASLAAARAGAREATGGAAGFLGAAGSTIGQNALKGFGYAFIGSAAAEIAGEALTKVTGDKGVGSTVGGIGTDVAYGAGIGALFGAPEIGAGVGLLGGILDQSGVFGGGSREESVKNERLKVERQKIEEGQSQRNAAIAGVELEVGQEIQASIRDESEAATKAKEKVGAQLQKFAATVKVFGAGSSQGKEALEEINNAVAAAGQALFETGPQNIAKVSALYDETLEKARKIAEEQLSGVLPSALPGPQTATAVNTYLGSFAGQREQSGEYREAQIAALEAAEAHKLETDAAYKADQEREQKKLEGFGLKGAKLNEQLYLYAHQSPAGTAKRQVDGEVRSLQTKVQQNLEVYGNSIAKEAEEIVKGLAPLQARLSLALKYGSKAEQRSIGSELARGYHEALRAQEDKGRKLAAEIGQHDKSIDEARKRLAEFATGPALPRVSESLRGFPATPFSGLAFANPAELQQKITSGEKTVAALRKALEAVYGKLKGVKNELAKLVELPQAVEEFGTAQKEIGTTLSLGLLGAHGNAKKEADARARAKKELDSAYKRTTGKYPGSQVAREGQVTLGEEANRASDEGLQQLQARLRLELSQIPASDKSGRAGAQANAAAREANYIKEHATGPGAFEKIANAQATANEAREAASESLSGEAKEMISLRGAIRKARDVGNPIALARDAEHEAAELLAAARTPREHLDAVRAGIEAHNQRQQAIEEEIGERGALKESREVEPADKTATRIKTLREEQAKAKTPQEKRKYKTEINNELIKQSQEAATEKQSQIDAELHVHKITNEQAIRELQGILKRRDLTRAQRREIEGHIYDLENEAQGQDLNVGTIRLPTLYDTKTLTPKNPIVAAHTAGASAALRVIGSHAQPITPAIKFEQLHHPPQLHQTNYIKVNVAGGHGAGERVAGELERHFRGTTRSHLRNARLTHG